MGNLWIADLDAGYAEAESLAAGIRKWLVSSHLVPAQRTRIVTGGRDGRRTPAPPRPPAGRPEIDITIGRTIFCSATHETVVYSGFRRKVTHRQAAPGEAVNCPHCGSGRPAAEVLAVADRWLAGGPGACACLYCERDVALGRWLWTVPRAFAYLGFRFWNWPPLEEEFLADLSRHLGHRTMTGILS